LSKLIPGKPLLASQPTPAAPLSFKLAQEFSFDSTLKRMSVIYEDTTKGVYHVFSKGAVESVLNLCVGRLDDHGEVTVLDEAENLKFHRDVNHRMEGMAEFGLVSLLVMKIGSSISVFWHLLFVVWME
jgi:magnesium-transporting ATPase (P-type)